MNQTKLKILFVLQTPWGTNFGMSKVHYDLKIAFEKLGHSVDWLDHDKLYPKGEGLTTHLFGESTQVRIFNYLKKHGNDYDVIDANQRCVPYSKEEMGFSGVLVFRSHGLPPVYRLEELHPLYKKMTTPAHKEVKVSLKNRVGDFKRFLLKGEGEWAFWDSVRYADVVHVLNQGEFNYLKVYGVPEKKLKLVPNGVNDSYITLGNEYLKELGQRSEISFVGSWTVRKGILHLPEIALALKDNYSSFNVLGVGTGVALEDIEGKFDKAVSDRVNVVAHYRSDELTTLLKRTKVGAFPSYIDGFGLAIIEQLALGIPVVAFDIPGPRDILKEVDESLLVTRGDVNMFRDKINSILNMPADEYKLLAEKCRARALDFRYSVIANQFLEIYVDKLLQR